MEFNIKPNTAIENITNDQIFTLSKGANANRAESIWIGVSQAFLNLPRVIFEAAWKNVKWIVPLLGGFLCATLLVVASIITGFITALIVPIAIFVRTIVFGFQGRLVRRTKTTIEE